MRVIQLVTKILLVTTNQILQLSFEAHWKTRGNLRKSKIMHEKSGISQRIFLMRKILKLQSFSYDDQNLNRY